jgi:hypothetical protein
MKDMIILFIHLLTTAAKLLGPGGAKAVIAENLLLKQQLLVVTRSRRRAPNLSTADRFLMGFWSLFLRPGRIAKNAMGQNMHYLGIGLTTGCSDTKYGGDTRYEHVEMRKQKTGISSFMSWTKRIFVVPKQWIND